jgi:hypothetical protein
MVTSKHGCKYQANSPGTENRRLKFDSPRAAPLHFALRRQPLDFNRQMGSMSCPMPFSLELSAVRRRSGSQVASSGRLLAVEQRIANVNHVA